YFFLGSGCEAKVVSQLFFILKEKKSCDQRDQTPAGIVTAEAIQPTLFEIGTKRIPGIAGIGPDRIVMRIEQDRGSGRIKSPVKGPDIMPLPMHPDIPC